MQPPFEIYLDNLHISDSLGHICTCENETIAKEILELLNKASMPEIDHIVDQKIN